MNAFRWRMILMPRSIALIVVMTLHWPAPALYVAAKLGIADLLHDGPKYHFSKHMDLEIMVMYGGRERTEDEYRRLLAAEGFAVTQVIETTTPFSLIEAAPV